MGPPGPPRALVVTMTRGKPSRTAKVCLLESVLVVTLQCLHPILDVVLKLVLALQEVVGNLAPRTLLLDYKPTNVIHTHSPHAIRQQILITPPPPPPPPHTPPPLHLQLLHFPLLPTLHLPLPTTRTETPPPLLRHSLQFVSPPLLQTIVIG